MDVTIKAIPVGNWKVNCYLVAIEDEAWLIDPGDEFDKIVNYFNLDIFKLKGILNTHGHFDHVGAIQDIKEIYKIPFLIHSDDERLINRSNLYRRMAGGLSTTKTPRVDKYLDNLLYLDLKDKRILIHNTPGHTEGGVCFELDGNLFTGDLFFESAVGRTDLPGGNKRLLITSINYVFDKFLGFRIHPGHGESFILNENLIRKFKLTI
jgi:glyoxylase-like metal-dependent hydrolase (beta-lactamase superfamily II)